jgi:hypothetical protein
MTMAPIQTMRVAARAATRIRVARALRGGGLGLIVGGAGALLGVAISKWMPLSGGASAWVLALCAGGGLIAGLLAGGLRRVGAGAGAGRLDEFLGLKDRLRSAVELDAAGLRSGFAALAIADAESRASGVRVSLATPIRPDRAWAIGGGVLLTAVGVWFLVPAREPPAPGLLAASSPESRREADARLERVIEELREEFPKAAPNPETERAIAEIESLRERIERDGMRSEDALAAAAAALERAAEEAGARSQRESEAERAIAEAAGSVADQTEGEARELARSLAEGDLERAREAARRMQEASRGMPPEARERLSRDVEQLVGALEQAKPAEPPVSSEDRDLADRLRERVENPTDRDAIAEALREEGLDPASAEELAERIAREESARRHRERTREEIDRMSEALREAADLDPSETDAERPEDAGGAPEEQPAPEESGESQDDAPTKGPESTERPGQRPPSPGAQDPTGRAPTERRTGEDDPKRTEPGGKPDEKTDGKPGEKPGEGADQAGDQPGEKRGEQPGEQSGEAPTEQPGEKPGEKPGETAGERPGETVREGAGEQPGESPGEGSDGEGERASEGKAPGAKDEPGASGGEGEGEGEESLDAEGSGEQDAPPGGGGAGEGGTLAEMLEQMNERRTRRAEDQRLSEDLRRRAQELLDQATPEQRQRLEEWALEETRRRGSAPGSMSDAGEEVVDARSRERDESGRVISEWFNPEGEAPAGVISEGMSGGQLKEAAAAAERAVEQQRVPTRYRRLVRDVFKRVQERGEKGGIAPLSEDAGG